MTATQDRAPSPVDHGCRLPLLLLVDTDGAIMCTTCGRAWRLRDEGGWTEIPRWPS